MGILAHLHSLLRQVRSDASLKLGFRVELVQLIDTVEGEVLGLGINDRLILG